MSKEFDPKNIIDFNKDYYSILGISKENLPDNKTRQNKIEISQLIEKSFRKQARKAHPDFGGSKELFLDLVRARRILEDPLLRRIYDQGHFDEFEITNITSDFAIDWNKVGTFRKGTPEDTIGFQLFLSICEKKDDLKIVPAFIPKTEEHNYEWDWVIDDKNKLVLSIVNDENEVLRLTNSDQIDDSLPFKIYICIPKTSLSFVRTEQKVLDPFGNTLSQGSIGAVSYNDFDLLETTNLNTATNYIENKLSDDLKMFKNGTLKVQTKVAETKWLDSNELKKFDKQSLSAILNMRSYEVVEDENAADFLSGIKDDEDLGADEKINPILPL